MSFETSRRTLAYYDANADVFWKRNTGIEDSKKIESFLEAIPGDEPFDVLDVGCGPGRHLREFKAAGHRAVGLEGCPRLAQTAREVSGCEVWEQDFLQLSLPAASFDGVFANAALFHVPSAHLPRILRELRGALRTGGILLANNPLGTGTEGWSEERYGCYFDYKRWLEFFAECFDEVHHFYLPTGRPLSQQKWLTVVLRKRDIIL